MCCKCLYFIKTVSDRLSVIVFENEPISFVPRSITANLKFYDSVLIVVSRFLKGIFDDIEVPFRLFLTSVDFDFYFIWP